MDRKRSCRLALSWAILGVSLAIGCSTPAARLKPAAPRAEASEAEAASRSLCDTIARDPRSPEAERALGELIRRWPQRSSSAERDGCQVAFDAAEPGTFAADYFDALTPAADFEVTRLPRHRRPGVGVPMVGLRENRHREAIEDHYPPEAITRPVTAVAEVARTPDGATLRVRLYSTLHHESVIVDGSLQPLAADFTVPFVATLERAGTLRGSWLAGLLDSEPERESQLYLMEPYDPRKTPLLMIHGLLSTPIEWAQLTNELWADPRVRRRYQIWHYHYPTSAPFLYSARMLRRHLDELRQLLRQSGEVEILPLVVIGHSMGACWRRHSSPTRARLPGRRCSRGRSASCAGGPKISPRSRTSSIGAHAATCGA